MYSVSTRLYDGESLCVVHVDRVGRVGGGERGVEQVEGGGGVAVYVCELCVCVCVLMNMEGWQRYTHFYTVTHSCTRTLLDTQVERTYTGQIHM